jgi:hypothetical protein
MAAPLLLDLQQRYRINPARLNRFDPIALKLLDLIFQSLKVTVDQELSLEWFTDLITAKGNMTDIWDWIEEKFMSPLRDQIIKLIEEEYDFAFENLKHGLGRYRSWIYRGIILYLQKTSYERNIGRVTAWDILDMLTNENGESLIKSVSFPSTTILVKFIVGNNVIPELYDMNLDQFMGVVLASMLINIPINVEIFGLETPIIIFHERLFKYNDNADKKYTLKLIKSLTGTNYDTFNFNNLVFLSGFVTLFSLINQDHQQYWIELTQWDDPEYPGRKKKYNFNNI